MYRDHLFAARCRRRPAPLSEPHLPLQRIYAARQGRIWGGVVGLAGFTLLLLDALLGPRYTTEILASTWLAALVSARIASLTAARALRRRVDALLAPTGDPLTDLARREPGGARSYIAQRVHHLEQASLILPLIALCLLAPLTLHLIVGVGFLGASAKQFNGWILLSLVLVGHAHAALVILAVRHIAAVRWALDTGAPLRGGSRGLLALLWTVAVSTVPGAMLLFVPPLLVAATGALFVPWVFHWAARRAYVERALLVEETGEEQRPPTLPPGDQPRRNI